ncbi:hypothetical protein PRK78_005254 [Emydomyces testavorans]|uniref:Uncharacterized protein n=1 Tax=Emydomyces testavorans TaxID=2070801 RepID=A0AAF0IMF8_9EURO|nr:hypothetical protein PRK78_005254 [Emydomyces testavorans]
MPGSKICHFTTSSDLLLAAHIYPSSCIGRKFKDPTPQNIHNFAQSRDFIFGFPSNIGRSAQKSYNKTVAFEMDQDRGRAASTSQTNLLSLPNELLIQVAGLVERRMYLARLVRSCRRLYEALNWYLYHQDAQDGSSALSWAVRKSKEATALRALQAGADIKMTYQSGGPRDVRFGRGWYVTDDSRPVEWNTLLHEAVIKRPWLKKPATKTAIAEHEKILQEHYKVMQLLIDYGVDVNADRARRGTALQEALWRGDTGSIELLIKNGAKIPEGLRENALCLAARRCSADSINLLIKKGLKINDSESDRSPLFIAAESGNGRAVRALINAGANVRFRDREGRTPLHAAADSSSKLKHSLSSISQMLIKSGADVNATTESGETPLFFAISQQHEKVVQCLLKAGARLDLRTHDGQTAMHVFASRPNEEIRKMLVRQRANFSLRDNIGRTPLHIASLSMKPYARKNYMYGSVYCEDKREDIEREAARQNLIYWLLENSADVDIQDQEGRTPIHLAVLGDDERMIGALARASMNCNVLDGDGYTPLHVAAILRKCGIIEELIQNGADVNARDARGNTPLHGVLMDSDERMTSSLLLRHVYSYHSMNTYEYTVEKLLEYGALPNIANDEGQTPEQIAISQNLKSLIKLLQNGNAENEHQSSDDCVRLPECA